MNHLITLYLQFNLKIVKKASSLCKCWYTCLGFYVPSEAPCRPTYSSNLRKEHSKLIYHNRFGLLTPGLELYAYTFVPSSTKRWNSWKSSNKGIYRQDMVCEKLLKDASKVLDSSCHQTWHARSINWSKRVWSCTFLVAAWYGVRSYDLPIVFKYHQL